MLVVVTPADVTDRDAAEEVLFRLAFTHPEISIVRADSAHAGKLVTLRTARPAERRDAMPYCLPQLPDVTAT